MTLDRDIAAAKVIENRGVIAFGQPVTLGARREASPLGRSHAGETPAGSNRKFTCGDRGAGIEQLTINFVCCRRHTKRPSNWSVKQESPASLGGSVNVVYYKNRRQIQHLQ